MPSIWGDFHVGGIPRNGATVKLWSEGAFASEPEKNTAIPSGSPIATVTTGPTYGCDGAYRFDAVASGSYYASISWNGLVAYQKHRIDDATGRGEYLASNYANLQAAINATPSGSVLYVPPGTYTTTTGFILTNKPISIIGSNPRRTKLVAGASGITVLTINHDGLGDDYNVHQCQFENFSIQNPSDYVDCTMLKVNRSQRNTFQNIHLDGGGVANTCTGMWFTSSWIQTLLGCQIENCTLGLDTRGYGASGPSTNINWFGGMIEDCTSGAILVNIGMMAWYGVTLEAITGPALYVSGGNRLSFEGGYFEANGVDLVVAGSARVIRIENPEKVDIQSGRIIEIDGYRPTADAILTITSETQKKVKFSNIWWGESSNGITNTAAKTLIDYWKTGQIQITDQFGEPSVAIEPVPYVRPQNLITNGGMVNSAAGWTLLNMAMTVTGLPFGAHAALATNSAVSGTTFRATKAIDTGITVTEDIQGEMLSMSCKIKIPDATWLNTRLVLVDGDENSEYPIMDAFKTGLWETIVLPIKLGEAADDIQWRLEGSIGASGQALMTQATLCLGRIPVGPEISRDLTTRHSFEPRKDIYAETLITTSGQIFASGGSYWQIAGSPGAVTVTTGQAFVSGAGILDYGQVVELWGSTNASGSPVTLVSGGNSGLRLGAATRTIGVDGMIRLERNRANGRWVETAFCEGQHV